MADLALLIAAVAAAAAAGVVLGRWIQYRTDLTVLINSLYRQRTQRHALERVVKAIAEGQHHKALNEAQEALQ